MSRVRKSGDKNQQILKALLKEPGNSHCADCKNASHPRWASWNLGIFICIRCSGIHRSMGTHISRVKSVDLDTWTDEQVQSMVKWGNSKANKFWEDKFPNQVHVPDDSKIENFIRTKYDLKKWAASKTIPDPSSIKTNGSISQQQPSQPSQPQQQSTRSEQSSSKTNSNNLLDLEFGSPIAAPRPASNQSSPQQSTFPKPSTNLESLNFNQKPQQSIPPPQQQSQPQRSLNQRPDLKKSILSLYSTPIASNSTPNFPPTNNNNLGHLQSQSTSNLNGLNFNIQQQPQVPQPQIQQNNVWNSSNQWSQPQNNSINQFPNTTSSNISSNPLDDDLFKNVWK